MVSLIQFNPKHILAVVFPLYREFIKEGPVMWTVSVFVGVRLNKLLNKQRGCRRFDTAWPSEEFIRNKMRLVYANSLMFTKKYPIDSTRWRVIQYSDLSHHLYRQSPPNYYLNIFFVNKCSYISTFYTISLTKILLQFLPDISDGVCLERLELTIPCLYVSCQSYCRKTSTVLWKPSHYHRVDSKLAPSQWETSLLVTTSLIGWAQTYNLPCYQHFEWWHNDGTRAVV